MCNANAAKDWVPDYFPNDNETFLNLCDAELVADDKKLPVHATILAMESIIFSDKINTLKAGKKEIDTGKLAIEMDDSISADDAKLMLSFLYGKRKVPDTVGSCSH